MLSDQKLLDHMIAIGLIKSTCVLGREIEIDDDQHNAVFLDRTIVDSGECDDDDCREDHQHWPMPIYAIEYGDTVEGEE